MNPIELSFESAQSGSRGKVTAITTFTSYNFDRSLLTPAAAFRFTAPGVDKAQRQSIRSGDMVSLLIRTDDNEKLPLGKGFIDETDTHVVPGSVEYVLTGRDTLGQLVDNAAVDAENKIVNIESVTLEYITSLLIQNTRIPAGIIPRQVPNGRILFRTSPEETKINALQRYLEFTNCLVWTAPSGQVVLGKPNFTQKPQGVLKLSGTNPAGNNVLEARIQRNPNQAIRQIIAQLQNLEQVSPAPYTKQNFDQDMRRIRSSLAGRSVYRVFSYGSGADAVNQVEQVGNQSGNPRKIGDELALRELALDNMKILEVEVVVRGHLNENNKIYNIDQIYSVELEDDDVSEDLYVHSCSYEMTLEHGMLTRMRLCKLGTIVAMADQLERI